MTNKLPQHIAIIMDGNGRWATQRDLPRTAGHRAGIKSAREVIQASVKNGIKVLSLFAFSSENWGRPAFEVTSLMELFQNNINKEVKQLHQNQVRLKFIGDLSRFNVLLQKRMHAAEDLTKDNPGLQLNIAMSYGGRWDIVNATRQIAKQFSENQLTLDAIDEETVQKNLCLSDFPEPDLFIRTSGEKRISNFCLWQLAYTELYFCDTLWPDFNENALDLAIKEYASRMRRFGHTKEQMESQSCLESA